MELLGEMFFIWVLRFNDEDVVEFFVERGVFFELCDFCGCILFYYVVEGGKLRNMLWLIEFGVDIFKLNF